jgi:hypothetical protein
VKTAVVVLFGATILLTQSASGRVALAEYFDKPFQEQTVDLGRSPNAMPDDPSHIHLSCFFYPDFMVKQLSDPAVKGTLWVTVTPVISGGDPPACRLAHSSTERSVAKQWWGFQGVKRSLLFLEAADGDENAGMPFRIVDMKTGQKVFEDSASGNSHPTFAPLSDGKISLRYLRRVGGDCSIPKDGVTCWSKFRKHYGLPRAAIPKCMGYRRDRGKEWAAGDEGVPSEAIETPSAINYPAAVDLFRRPLIRALPGLVQCFPVQ